MKSHNREDVEVYKKFIFSRNPIEAYTQGRKQERKEWEDQKAGECTLQGMIYIKDMLRQIAFEANDRANESNHNGKKIKNFMTRPQLKIFIDRLLNLCEREIKKVIAGSEDGLTAKDKVDLLYQRDEFIKNMLEEAYEKQNKINIKKMKKGSQNEFD